VGVLYLLLIYYISSQIPTHLTKEINMIDWVLAVLSLYGVYRGYIWLKDHIEKEEKENEIFRRSEDENDITDWWI